MIDIGTIKMLLEAEKSVVSRDAMEVSNGSAVILQQAVGRYAGLHRALELIEKAHADDEDRRENL